MTTERRNTLRLLGHAHHGTGYGKRHPCRSVASRTTPSFWRRGCSSSAALVCVVLRHSSLATYWPLSGVLSVRSLGNQLAYPEGSLRFCQHADYETCEYTALLQHADSHTTPSLQLMV